MKRNIRFSYILAGFNLLPFILFLFAKDTLLAGVTGLVSTVIYFTIRYWIVRKKKEQYYIDENIFFILAAVWLLQSNLMAILILLTGILFRLALQPLRFIFTKEGIRKDFTPKKKYEWDELQTVILKGGILTLDFKNNKLLQSPVEPMSREEATAFNEFSHQMLTDKELTDQIPES